MRDSLRAGLRDPDGESPVSAWLVTYCIRDSPWLLWPFGALHLAIGLAYFAIPYRLERAARANGGYMVSGRVVRLFAAFIRACGCTHFAAIAAAVFGVYALELAILAGTAAISWVTVWHLRDTFRLVEAAAQEQRALREHVATLAATRAPDVRDFLVRVQRVQARVAALS